MKRFIITLIVAISSAVILHARIIYVPAEYGTIQAGIDVSLNGDTVFVEEGEYHERIDFNGHNIVLCSRFLTFADTLSIEKTIIDGDSLGTTVKFQNHEDSTAAIIGFTIRHGINTAGGGISCRNSSPKILWNIICENASEGWNGGAGIFGDSSNSLIAYNRIRHNYSDWNGGGMSFRYSEPKIYNNIITQNTAYE